MYAIIDHLTPLFYFGNLDAGSKFCFRYDSGAQTREDDCIEQLSKQGYSCHLPCENDCEEKIAGVIVQSKWLEGVTSKVCANDGGLRASRNTACLKGDKIDESKYTKWVSISCLKDDCQKYFDALKKKKNWSDSCTYKLVYKEYDRVDDKKSKFWIYTDKETCK